MESAIAKNVKAIIKAQGIKQKVIAEKAGFGEKDFSNMLNGRKLISDVHVVAIRDALGVSFNEIFGIDNEQKGA